MVPIKSSAPCPRRPVVTLGLIAINAIVFVYELSMPEPLLERFIRTYGLIPEQFWAALLEAPTRFDLWLVPLSTSMFIHGGWGHLIGNMLFLWVFGDGVENRIGSGRFALFYGMVGVAATLAHAGFNVGSGVPTVGASGAIAGVLGAYLWLYPRSTVVLMIPIFFWPFFFQVPAFLFLGIWFLEQLFFGAASTLAPITTESGGVAWWAHAGGFLAGFVAILPLARGRDEPDPLERTNLFPDERERRY